MMIQFLIHFILWQREQLCSSTSIVELSSISSRSSNLIHHYLRSYRDITSTNQASLFLTHGDWFIPRIAAYDRSVCITRFQNEERFDYRIKTERQVFQISVNMISIMLFSCFDCTVIISQISVIKASIVQAYTIHHSI